MNERNSGKRVRLLQKPLVIAGIIVAVVLVLVAVIAIPHFLSQPRFPKDVRILSGQILVPYFVDYDSYPDYPAWSTDEEAEEAAKSASIDITRFLGMSPKKEYRWKKTW